MSGATPAVTPAAPTPPGQRCASPAAAPGDASATVRAAVAAAMAAASGAAPPVQPSPSLRRRGRPPGSGRKAALAVGDPADAARARRSAAVVLDVLAGNRSTRAAAQALGVSLVRYYAIEAQAIAGLVAALAPRPPGGGGDALREAERLRAQNRRLEQAVARQQALVRLGQRALGVAPPPAKPAKAPPPSTATGAATAKRTRNRRPAVRALRLARRLADAASALAPPGERATTPGDRRGG